MRDEIIKMAREAGIDVQEGYVAYCDIDDLVCFFHMAQAHALEHIGNATMKAAEKAVETAIAAEREACAKVCEDSVPTYLKDGERWLKGQNGRPDVRLKEIAPNLEATWEAEQLLKNGSVLESYSVQRRCAAAIRARGQA